MYPYFQIETLRLITELQVHESRLKYLIIIKVNKNLKINVLNLQNNVRLVL